MDYAGKHLRIGWWSLLLFATLGLTLEALHGFKVRAYVDTSNETRRLMWTLAHAHGVGLAIVHVAFGLMLRVAPDLAASNVRTISTALVAAIVLLPGGFFLGGVAFYSGDPGVGIVLVPAGAASLLFGVYSIARGIRTSPARSAETPSRR